MKLIGDQELILVMTYFMGILVGIILGLLLGKKIDKEKGIE